MERFKRVILVCLTVVLTCCAACALSSCGSLFSTGGSGDMTGYREPLSEGVENTLTNALYMYNTFWTPLENVKAWYNSGEIPVRVFAAGHTYRGIPYGQPVHKGAYVGSIATVKDFVNAVNDPSSLLYTSVGENTWEYTDHGGPIKYSPYFSNDCSGFVSAAMGIKRHTTRDIGGDKELFPVKGSDVLNALPGDLINSHEGGHVIMVLDVIYTRKGGDVKTIVTIEQTPDIIIVRSYGEGGVNGSLGSLQERVNSGKYYLCRYRDIDSVKLIDGALESMPKVFSCVTSPSSVMAADKACEGNLYVDPSKGNIGIEGYALTAGKVSGFEYSFDGENYKSLGKNGTAPELSSPAWGFSYLKEGGSFKASLPLSGVSEGSLLRIRGVYSDGSTFEVAALTVKNAPESVSFEACIDSYGLQYTSSGDHNFEEDGKLIKLNGWCVSDDIVRFEIKTDNGQWFPLGQRFRDDVYSYIGYQYPNCRECNAFEAAVDVEPLVNGKHTVTLRAVASDGLVFTVAEVTASKQEVSSYLYVAIAVGAVLILVFLYSLPGIKRGRKALRKPEAEKTVDEPEAQEVQETPEVQEVQETQEVQEAPEKAEVSEEKAPAEEGLAATEDPEKEEEQI